MIPYIVISTPWLDAKINLKFLLPFVALFISCGVAWIIFRGEGTPRRLQGYHVPPQFPFLKRCKVLENKSIFQKYHIFSCQKINFSKKDVENWASWTRISASFRKLIYELSIFLNDFIDSEKFPLNSNIELRNLSKKLEACLCYTTLGKWMIIF